ncbi:MAG: beta-lactamase family protein [Desulfomonile tiedjei]|nr:beta-lactamase family protein [Desulfomonile tiedjei]
MNSELRGETVPTSAFQLTDKLMNQALAERLFTAAALRVVQQGRILFRKSYGTIGDPGTAAVQGDTLFDLASLTKVLTTTPCWMLVSATNPGILDRPLSHWFPEPPPDKRGITPRQLLAHGSGLPAWRPYYLFSYVPGPPIRCYERIMAESLEYEPGKGCLYSDLGFMLLAAIIERETGRSINQFAEEEIYAPLKLSDQLMFKPQQDQNRIALTHRGDQPGLVHDLNCRAMGGVSGHAGLFGTAKGVSHLAEEILAGLKSRKSHFDPASVRSFCARAGFVEGCTRALGFDTPSEKDSSSGRFFAPDSLGHTGFTGTSLWIDPEKELIVVLLTNRVFMGESDQRIKAFRPLVHDTIRGEIGD